MTDVLPEPLVPAEVDLRGLEWMPLLGDRLFGSATWIAASAEAKVAALRLWWRAYAHEAPAASVPDDDALLADYAGYGVAVKAWRKLRPQALRGWVKCSDGRLYHPLLATLVMEAWQRRLRAREKQARYRGRSGLNDGNKAGDVTVTSPSRDRLCDRDVTPDRTGQRQRQGQEGQDQEQEHAPAGATRPRKPRTRATPVPDDFAPSERVRAWAAGKGFDRLDEHAEAFVSKCRAKGYTYADHDAALMEAIRQDWAGLRNGRGAAAAPAPKPPRLMPAPPPGVPPPEGLFDALRASIGGDS